VDGVVREIVKATLFTAAEDAESKISVYPSGAECAT
jgi:hypothetical protein